MNSSSKILAVFDFDGTITYKDSFLEFIRFTHGSKALWLGMLRFVLPIIGYFLKLYPNDKLKELFFSFYYKGHSKKDLDTLGKQFAQARLPDICYPSAMSRLTWHRKEGHRIIILTASPAIWLASWCQELGVELIATEFELKEEKYTGRLKGKNCRGKEKIKRLEESVNLKNYQTSYGYGNDSSDWFFLDRMEHKYFNFFKRKK